MSDLINRDSLLKKCVHIDGLFSDVVSAFDIAYEPTVDAVPVVRCKDCKRCRNGCQCDVPLGVSEMEKYILVDEDDFCSYGERKETD